MSRSLCLGPAWLGAVLLSALVGCAGVNLPKNPFASPPRGNSEEKQAQLEEYEQKRDQALLEAAKARLDQGDESACQTALQQILLRSPKHRPARLLLVDLHLAGGKVAAATELATAVLADYPDDAAALHAKGLVEAAAGRTDAARDFFARAAQADPNNLQYAHSHQLSLGQVPEVAPTAPANADALARYAKTEVGQQWVERGVAALRARQMNEAETAFRQAVGSEQHNPQLPLRIALVALAAGHNDLAQRVLNDATRQYPRELALWRLQGLIRLRQGDSQAALAALEQARALDNRDGLTCLLLGHALEQLGQPQASAEHFALAAQLDPQLATRR